MQWLASQGITLTNYWAVTHPSEPNYAACVGGDNFGMDNDDFITIPTNVSTVVDLLDTKAISWGEYQESLPYAGYQGFNFSNQQTYANDYVRKHNPLIVFDSIAKNATRAAQIKNFTSFTSDLKAQTLPQWSFITPNMTNDGHDTNISFAASWARTFLTPLLQNSYFMNNTLIILTFDEDETYTSQNKVFAILLGGAVPTSLANTTDDTFYTHYSTISSVSMNWGLPSLGRWDCMANVLALVANKTGYANLKVDATNLYLNQSYPGPLSDALYSPAWAVPATGSNVKCTAGNGVLASVVSTWSSSGAATYNYSTSPYPYDAVNGINIGGSVSPGASPTGTSPSSSTSPSAAATSSSAADANTARGVAAAAAMLGGLVALFL
jgi:acid phosphatase